MATEGQQALAQRVDYVFQELEQILRDFKAKEVKEIAGVDAEDLPRMNSLFIQDFTSDIRDFWTLRAGSSSDVTFPTNGTTGGRVYRKPGGRVFMEFPQNLPYDPVMVYRLRARAKLVNARAGTDDFSDTLASWSNHLRSPLTSIVSGELELTQNEDQVFELFGFDGATIDTTRRYTIQVDSLVDDSQHGTFIHKTYVRHTAPGSADVQIVGGSTFTSPTGSHVGTWRFEVNGDGTFDMFIDDQEVFSNVTLVDSGMGNAGGVAGVGCEHNTGRSFRYDNWSVTAHDLFRWGLQGFDANGDVVDRTGGTSPLKPHVVGADAGFTESGSFVDFEAYLTGNGATGSGSPGTIDQPAQMHQDAKSVRPFFDINPGGASAEVEVDYIAFDVLTISDEIDALATRNAPAESGAQVFDGKDLSLLANRFFSNLVRSGINTTGLNVVVSQIDDVGDLGESILVDDGAAKRVIAKGVQDGRVQNGQVVTFDPVYQDAPTLIFNEGGLTGDLGSAGAMAHLGAAMAFLGVPPTTGWDPISEVIADGLSASGFTAIARYVHRNQTTQSHVEILGILDDPNDISSAAWSSEGTPVVTADDTTAPDGTVTADKLEDDNASGFEVRFQGVAVPNDTLTRAAAVFVKKQASFSSTFELEMGYVGGTNKHGGIQLNPATGATAFRNNADGGDVVDLDADWWLLWLTMANNGTGNTTWRCRLYPAVNASGADGTADSSATGSAHVWGSALVDNPNFILDAAGEVVGLGGLKADSESDEYRALYDLDLSINSADSLVSHDDDFSVGVIEEAGQNKSVSLTAESNDDSYDVRYSVDMEATAAEQSDPVSDNLSGTLAASGDTATATLSDQANDGVYTLEVFVDTQSVDDEIAAVIESNDGGGWVQEATWSIVGDAPGGTGTATKSFTNTALVSGDEIRVRSTDTENDYSASGQDVSYTVSSFDAKIEFKIGVDSSTDGGTNWTRENTETFTVHDTDGTGDSLSVNRTKSITEAGATDVRVIVDSVTETGTFASQNHDCDPNDVQYQSGSAETATIKATVALDSKDGAGAWVERDTRLHELTDSTGNGQSRTDANQELSFSDSKVDTGDDIRFRLKAVTVDGNADSSSVELTPRWAERDTFDGQSREFSKTPLSVDDIKWKSFAV